MGRPKLFDESQVLTAAMYEFWGKGYVGTSTADLCRVTQLNPGSIYYRYSDKRGLFLRSLEHYIEDIVDARIGDMLACDKPIEGIEHFFSSAYESVTERSLMGCLLTNTALELSVEERSTLTIVNRGIKAMERAFEVRVCEAVEEGHLSAQLDSKASAVYLASCFQGLMVTSRLTKNKSRLRTITQQTMLMLGQPKRI